jgi:putative nucleotidyltransferase with HDIG domain/PAS domain S-box-containing protein
MSNNQAFYLIPYFASLGISVGVLVYTWYHRDAKGVTAYSFYVAAQSLWIFGFIFELVSPTLSGKIFWDGFEWLAGLLSIVAIPVFAVQYSEYNLKNPERSFLLTLVIPALFTLLLMTDSLHHLIYVDPKIIPGTPFTELSYSFTPAVFVFAFYTYGISLWSLGRLIQRALHLHDLYRVQTTIIIIGFIIPILSTLLSLSGVQITPQRDSAPFTFTAANIVIALGLFQFRLFKVVPVGRDRLFESMVDPVVILDNQHIVVDINSAMLALLDKESAHVIGLPAKEVFENFPIPIKMYTHVSYARAEATFDVRGRSVYYEMTVWPLYDSNKQMKGRIYISHDITALKDLEQELRDLNLDLEKRVRARTFELAEAYDTTLEGWAKALELRDKETEGHSRRVTETTLAVARAMGIEAEQLTQIRRGALLHDIGKMGIPDHILRKDGELSEEEREVVRKHPETAYELLKQIPFLEHALEIPYSHHEKWDGSGYPRGLKERAIPISARIFAVVDVWDALTSDRPYRKAWSKEKTIQYLIDQAGRHFDPRVVNVFLYLVEKGEI